MIAKHYINQWKDCPYIFIETERDTANGGWLMESISNEAIVTHVLKAIPHVWAIYRFGSAGTPFERPDSDIDLAILMSNPLDNLARWELAQSLAVSLNKDVDLVDLPQASTVLRQQIVSHGQCIYCADRFTSEEFESRALSDYARLNESRRQILRDIQKRRKIHA